MEWGSDRETVTETLGALLGRTSRLPCQVIVRSWLEGERSDRLLAFGGGCVDLAISHRYIPASGGAV